LFFGVKAAGKQLEDIAEPLTAADATPDGPEVTEERSAGEQPELSPQPATAHAGEPADENQARAAERHAAEERIRARIERRRQRERSGLRRYRPGPGSLPTARVPATSLPADEQALENEIEAIQRALDEHGSTERRELARLVGARYWGPGVFREALHRAIADGDVQRTSRHTYAPDYHNGNAEP
jgi:hypothetical protein